MKRIFLISVFLLPLYLWGQIAVHQWRDHLPYSHGVNVEVGWDKVYCLTTGGLFEYNKADNSISKLNKINGLSDVEINTIRYHNGMGLLVIGYKNANIDIIKEGTIYNISDIKRKQITGNKTINNIMFVDNLAYLACGFGIVVVDLDRMEIKDTYLIGSGGSFVEVNDLDNDGDTIFAATDQGLYKAYLHDPNLVNFSFWSRDTKIPNFTQTFSSVRCLDNKVYAIYKGKTWDTDTIYSYDYNTWEVFDSTMHTFKRLETSSNRLMMIGDLTVKMYVPWEGNFYYYYWYINNKSHPRDAVFDDYGNFWIADDGYGLVYKIYGSNAYGYTYPNGPNKKNVASMCVEGGQLWMVPGGHDDSWNNQWVVAEISIFNDEVWQVITPTQEPELTNAPDLYKVVINPQRPSQAFIGSYGGGVVEYNNFQFVQRYDETNSSLQQIEDMVGPYVRIAGMAFDSDQNLWVTNSGVENTISVRKADGTWKGFNLKAPMVVTILGDIICTQNGHKWVILPRGNGLFAFSENGTFDNDNDDQYLKFSVVNESGELISNDVYCIAEDQDGLIWVGTNKGIVVYFNPENVFDGSNFYASQIKIPNETNEGQANYLLESETVTSIAVDGANRKWVGTQRGGVFLLSEDGMEQLYHFTVENSPLLSDNIISISIDQQSGEVYFATELGVISYRGTATMPDDYFKDVYVFPNPVKENYTGVITIKGLVANANVKITDISGNLVFETQAEGGQAIWTGKNFSGEKVSTGVYLVFCTNEDGSKTHVTKLLFIN